MNADIEDVARRAGVSTATVSRALRGLPNVSDATRRKVQIAADELDYVSSPSASRLASGHTGSIGIVVPYLGRWFFNQALAGAVRVLRMAGYDVLLFTLPDHAAQVEFFDRMPLRRRVDGVIVLTLPLDEDERLKMEQLGVPLAAVGTGAPRFSVVGIDDFAGAQMATQHLINLGHERIAMIGGADSSDIQFTTPEARREGYRRAMAEAGLTIPAGYERDGRFTADGGEAAMGNLLAMAEPPTAVFAQSDEMAVGAIRALRRSGLACPEDVSVVGFDDSEIAELVGLTTISQPVELQGEIAARQLLAAIGGSGPTQEVVPVSIVLRGTTAPPADETSPAPTRAPHTPAIRRAKPLRRPTTGENQ